MPATPMATSVVPCRQARPKESVTITAGAAPKRAASASRIAAADASGSRGSSTTQSSPGVFERSTPALAQTKPCSVSAMTRSPRRRRTARASRRITVHMVVGPLDTALRLGDDLLGDDQDVALLQAAGPLDRVAEERGEVVARPHLRHRPREEEQRSLGQAGDPHARVRLVAAVHVQEHGRQRLQPARDLEPAAVDRPALRQVAPRGRRPAPSPRASSPARRTSSSSGTSGSDSALALTV